MQGQLIFNSGKIKDHHKIDTIAIVDNDNCTLPIPLKYLVHMSLLCRRQVREQQELYHHQLKEMKERVETRPLLFEQDSQTCIRRSAESKYIAALKKAGLTEEDIQALNELEGRRAGNA